jgi:hypothetical protein
MGNRIRSALTKMVNRKNMMKANAHAAFKVKLSGQLRFLGLFSASVICLLLRCWLEMVFFLSSMQFYIQAR